MSEESSRYERLSPSPVPTPEPSPSIIRRAGTRGLRLAAAVFLLLFLPGAWLYFNAWAAYTHPTLYAAPLHPPLPPIPTACHLMAAIVLYCAARAIEAVHVAAERTPP